MIPQEEPTFFAKKCLYGAKSSIYTFKSFLKECTSHVGRHTRYCGTRADDQETIDIARDVAMTILEAKQGRDGSPPTAVYSRRIRLSARAVAGSSMAQTVAAATRTIPSGGRNITPDNSTLGESGISIWVWHWLHASL